DRRAAAARGDRSIRRRGRCGRGSDAQSRVHGGDAARITDCLNIGNPERPKGAWQLTGTVEGITAACDALGVPVVSGNVSLYNATHGADIWPTAVIGAVGRLGHVTKHIPPTTGKPGDLVLPAGSAQASLGASAYGAMRETHEG